MPFIIASRQARPDPIRDGICEVILNSEKGLFFNDIMEKFTELYQSKGHDYADKDMLRLRAYERLINLVQNGAVNKIGKEYKRNSKTASYLASLTGEPVKVKDETPEPVAKKKPKFGFDDYSIGLYSLKGNIRRTGPKITRPPGLSNKAWYAHATAIIKLLPSA